MKSITNNFAEAMELVHQIAEFDSMSMEIILCMTIDTESAEHKESVVDILARVCTAVQAVNEELGPYTFKGDGYDHKN